MARNVLLVEADRVLARVIARALERRHVVTVQPSAEGALQAMRSGLDVDVLVSAYRLGQGTTSRRLLSELRWRTPRPRLVLYSDEQLRRDAQRLADEVVQLPGDFAEILQAVER
jgi:DNA-binding NarL/FixJ family response regulator